jgi:aspartate carbamoyltransferase catalytic subunit
MHPGPVNRGVELAAEVIDSPQALIVDQVESGVVVRMAVLYELLAGGPGGGPGDGGQDVALTEATEPQPA